MLLLPHRYGGSGDAVCQADKSFSAITCQGRLSFWQRMHLVQGKNIHGTTPLSCW